MDSENATFCNAQNQFYNWTSEWMKSGYSDLNIQPDVIEIVSLFQILGYKIRYMDFSNPLDVTPLEHGGKGIRVVMSCNNSGLRATLELEQTCRCPQNVNEVKQWEVTGTEPKKQQEEIKVRGNDLLLPVLESTQKVVKNVLTQLFKIVLGKENDDSMVISPIKPTPPIIKIHSPEIPMSPARYRSLDTLTKPENISEIPEPGVLKKLSPMPEVPLVHTCSSPNLIANSKPTHTSSPIKSNEALYNKLLTVKRDIEETIALFLSKDAGHATELNFDLSKIKKSTESLTVHGEQVKRTSPVNRNLRYGSLSNPNLTRSNSVNIPSVRSTERGKPPKPLCRRPIRSCGDSTTRTQKESNDKVSRKSIESVSSIPKVVISKPTSKPTIKKLDFSHIKSTIPKITTKKSNVDTSK